MRGKHFCPPQTSNGRWKKKTADAKSYRKPQVMMNKGGGNNKNPSNTGLQKRHLEVSTPLKWPSGERTKGVGANGFLKTTRRLHSTSEFEGRKVVGKIS